MSLKHEDYIKALKNAALNTGKKVLVKKISEKLPFLFIPVLNPITMYVISKFLEVLIEETEFAIFFEYVDFRVDKQGREFSEAAVANLRAKLSGDPEVIRKTELELMAKFKTFALITRM